MEINNAIDILKEYVEIDRQTRDTDNHLSDYDKFCEEKCIAIETLIDFVTKTLSDKNNN